MMAQHPEVKAALDDIGTGSLSTVDYAYYTEAMARITTKLAEVGRVVACTPSLLLQARTQ